ncbi:MAG: carboxymuconolactone decarboxylase family protein [Methanomicrobiales archaeon]|nr:carboxymuconolactone decarboxylase family protein [Methanomicrobiales archaeon]MDI6876138.1 carboxymuconolactone decarboxylase family protein [Methanomicrobiales archaeon]
MAMDSSDAIPLDCPHREACLSRLAEVRGSTQGIDGKVRQLISIGIQTAAENPAGVRYHAALARAEGATAEEIVDAVIVNLRTQDLAPVLGCLQVAVDALEGRR